MNYAIWRRGTTPGCLDFLESRKFDSLSQAERFCELTYPGEDVFVEEDTEGEGEGIES